MMVRSEQAADGIVAFIDGEILPKMSGLQLWLAAAAVVSARKRLDVLLSMLMENKVVSALGIINADGTVDLETTIETAKATARKHGALTLDIPTVGEIRLAESDFDLLKKYIVEAGG